MKGKRTIPWESFRENYHHYPEINLSLDISRAYIDNNDIESVAPLLQRAFSHIHQIEAGAIANPDEKRQVGHYWLRQPSLAPDESIQNEIRTTLREIHAFVRQIHDGSIQGEGGPFSNLLLIGIGGSALGPQFVAQALGASGKLKFFSLDNTDPDGIDMVLDQLKGQLNRTLTLVISKSGGTKETRNGMLETEEAYRKNGLDFSRHAVAVTGVGSALAERATKRHWLKVFPMWEWVGGRTSELSAVGLLPAALQGVDIEAMLRGARDTDELTRRPEIGRNPAAILALSWHIIGEGKGKKDMVIIPYKDRLQLFSRYLQQLIMESLGKELDLEGHTVHQGISVYGNKGSTDQHAYIQQLRDGLPNFFVTFIEVRKDREGPSIPVEEGVTTGDYLQGFLLGTRSALYENERPSLTLTLETLDAYSIGVLIALYERAVGLYASMIGINAYHQPGVEAGKIAAEQVISLKRRLMDHFEKNPGSSYTVEQLATALHSNDYEWIFELCERLAANPGTGLRRKEKGPDPFSAEYEYAARSF